MRPQDFDQEELLMMLQEALTAAASGHGEHLKCPICEKGDLAVEARDDGWLHLQCPQCGLDFQGLLENPDDVYLPGAMAGARRRDPFG